MKYLYTPGPVTVPDYVTRAMQEPLPYHRGPEFQAMLLGLRPKLPPLFGTKNPVTMLLASGSMSMEASIFNLFSPQDKVIVLSAGRFGERFAAIARTYPLQIVQESAPWGNCIPASRLKDLLQAHPDAKGVCAVYCESSTGVVSPIAEYGALLQNTSTLFVVDAISAIGNLPMQMDDWNVDFAIGASQKGFRMPPGMSVVSMSDKARQIAQKSQLPRYCLDILKEETEQAQGWTLSTPSIALIQAMNASMTQIQKEGYAQVFAQVAKEAKHIRQQCLDWGFRLVSKSLETTSNSVSVLYPPEGIQATDIVQKLQEHDIQIGSGQDLLKGKAIRIGHMSGFQSSDTDRLLTAMRAVLDQLQGA